jgi:PIN domain nuclease of toxin-antitoxin system
MDVMHIGLAHVLQVEKLPDHHKDPFDRLLIAQAMTEKLSVITADHQFQQYKIKTIND